MRTILTLFSLVALAVLGASSASGAGQVASLPTTLRLEVAALGGATGMPLGHAQFEVRNTEQPSGPSVGTDEMETAEGEDCPGVSSDACGMDIPLEIEDGQNQFAVRVLTSFDDRLAVYSGDCRGAQSLAINDPTAVVELFRDATGICRVWFVQADDAGAGANSVVVVEKTFDLDPDQGQFEAGAEILDGLTGETLVDGNVAQFRGTSPMDGGDCRPLASAAAECEWIAAFASPGHAVRLLEEDREGWFAAYGGDCDRFGGLELPIQYQLRSCTIENVKLEAGSETPDRLLTVELVATAPTGDVEIEIRETVSGNPLLAELESRTMLESDGAACDPVSTNVCRGDVGIDDSDSTPVLLEVGIDNLPANVTGLAFSGACSEQGAVGTLSLARKQRATCRIELEVEEVVVDTTPPTVIGVPDRPANGAGWYDAPVTIDWQATDDSGSATDPANTTASTNGTVLYTSDPSCDPSGNCDTGSLTLPIDQVAPAVTCGPTPTFALNAAGSVAATVTDGHSGPVSASISEPADTSTAGLRSLSLTGEDLAGNTTTVSCPYAVGYVFGGFFQPVDNGGVLNVVKAGRAIPLKWRLTDASGVPVTTLASVTISVQSLACSAGATSDLVEETTAGASGLQNLGDGYYQLNWKSPASYAGSCKTLRLYLGDGSVHTALFRFTK